MRKTVLLFLMMTIAFLPLLAEATVVDGSVWTEFYAYKDKIPVTQSHIRSLQGLRIGTTDAFIPGLSFFVNGRVASDLSHKLPTDSDFRVYGAYLEYTRPRLFTVKAGRQYMYAGLGGFTMDGGRLDLNLRKYLTLTGYAGTTPGPTFYDYDKVNNWNKSDAFGGHLKFSGVKHLTVGASFLEQRFKPESFRPAGDTVTINPKIRTDLQVGSIDATYGMRMCNVYGRTDYDFIFKRLKMVTIIPTIKTKQGHSCTVDYTYRRPSLPFSNMFSVFEGKPYNQVRINPTYRINKDLYGLGSFAYTRYSDLNNTRVSAGAAYKGESAGIVFAKGYQGVKLGVFGYLFYELRKDIMFYVSGDAFNYKLDENADKTIGNVAASVGTRFTLVNGLITNAEAQFLTNATYKNDTRFYLKFEYERKTIMSTNENGGGSR